MIARFAHLVEIEGEDGVVAELVHVARVADERFVPPDRESLQSVMLKEVCRDLLEIVGVDVELAQTSHVKDKV